MPLAERMRPRSLEDLIGHEDLVGENGVLRRTYPNRSCPIHDSLGWTWRTDPSKLELIARSEKRL